MDTIAQNRNRNLRVCATCWSTVHRDELAERGLPSEALVRAVGAALDFSVADDVLAWYRSTTARGTAEHAAWRRRLDAAPAAVVYAFARGGRNFQRIHDRAAEQRTFELWADPGVS